MERCFEMAIVGIDTDIVGKAKAKRGRPKKNRDAPLCEKCHKAMTHIGGSLYECKDCNTTVCVSGVGSVPTIPPEENWCPAPPDPKGCKDPGILSLRLKRPLGLEHICIGADQVRTIMSDATIACPKHYIEGRKYEPIDVAEDWGLDKDAYLFNAFKYIARAGRKGSEEEDLLKAVYYLQRRVATIQKAKRGVESRI